MKDRIEDQQNFSMAVMVAVASVFDSKAGADIGAKLKEVIDNLEEEQQALYADIPEDYVAPESSSVNRTDENKKDKSGLSRKEVKAWKNAAKVDALMSKLTGRPTGAPWSTATDGNIDQPIAGAQGRIDNLDGQAILNTMENMRSRIPAGPNRRASSVKPGAPK